MFFSEEGGSPPGENQKTFTIALARTYGTWPAKSRIVEPAQNQKSFGSFIQKGTFLP
jgi:hypothetical protein